MIKIYIVRHGETQWNREEIFRGTKDIPLNEKGKWQAEKTGCYFQDKGLTHIVSSPLQRALQTAQAISQKTGVPVGIMDEFTDINFGIWEGLSVEEVKNAYPDDFDLWRTSPQKLRVKGGETLDIVRTRISSGISKIFFSDNDSIVIVTHRVICKLIVLYCLKIGNEHFWDMKYDPSSVTLLEKTKDGFTLIFSNNTCHLREAAPTSGYRDF